MLLWRRRWRHFRFPSFYIYVCHLGCMCGGCVVAAVPLLACAFLAHFGAPNETHSQRRLKPMWFIRIATPCVTASIELTGKWRRVNLHGRATRWLDLTRRERMKQISESLRGFGVHQKAIQAMLPNLQCRGLCVASTVAAQPDALVGTSDDSWSWNCPQDLLCAKRGPEHACVGIIYLFIYLITGLLDNIRHCCPVDGPSQTQ